MKEFLLGVGASAFAAGLIASFNEWRRHRVTFVTKHGQRVYDCGMKDKLGWTLPQVQIEAVEDVILRLCVNWGFPTSRVLEYFKNNEIFYRPLPMVDPDPRRAAAGSGFVNAYYWPNEIYLGVSPRVWKTGLVHETAHDFLLQNRGDPDTEHKLSEYWEAGFVGAVNAELEALFPLKQTH